ncbi:MAG: hypothetical protein D6775_04870, partial [Caldilineae bacterium]
RQLIVNPDFDQGIDGYQGWVQNLYLTSSFEDLAGVRHTGAWFGGATETSHGLYQDITIPQDAPTAQLSFLWALNPPTLTDTLPPGEALTITVESTAGHLLQTLMVIDNASERRLWKLATFDLSNYVARRIRFRAVSTTHQTTTSWYLDKVHLYTCFFDRDLYLPYLILNP